MKNFIVKNVLQTNKLAKKFAKKLIGGEVILLSGDLGAGKTTFTKAMFLSLGVKVVVTSPTFTILKEYETKKLNLYHFDMYRIEDNSELIELGFYDYLNKTDSVVVIEWFDKIKNSLKGKFINIEIKKIDENKREFIIDEDYIL